MSDNVNDQVENKGPSSCRISAQEVRRSLEAEIQEMEKYKWYLGEQLRHDPLQDRSLNDIYCEWIDKYASDFRRDWGRNK
jgi:predicted DNA-binding protein